MSSLLHNTLILVITPKYPSDPMNNYFKSIPVLSFLIEHYISKISPFPVTTSRPKMCPLRDPYFTKYFPPAQVETFPPIVHEPFAPKSQGISQLYFFNSWFTYSNIIPPSTVKISVFSSKLINLFIFSKLIMISSYTGTEPPTNPVFPD